MKPCWVLLNILSSFTEMVTYMQFVFYSLNTSYYWFAYIQLFFPSWDTSYSSALNNLLSVLLSFTCSYFVKDFCYLYSSRILTYDFHLYCPLSLSGFDIRIMSATWNKSGGIPSSYILSFFEYSFRIIEGYSF